MVKLLYTLPDEIQKKNIYIWDIDKDSITEFTKLAIRQINIKGFVVPEEKYIEEEYLNRPIVGIGAVQEQEDVIVIRSGKCDGKRIPEVIRRKVFLYTELIQVDQGLKKKKAYIYGAGKGGEEIYKELRQNEVEIEAFCVSEKKDGMTVEGKKVYQIDEILQYENSAFVISVLREQYREEIIDRLERYDADIYIRDFINDDIILCMSLFQSLYKAWHDQKKIYVYSRKKGWSFRLIEETLKLYSIQIKGCVCKDADKESEIQDVYGLAYERAEDIYVLINDVDITERRQQIEVYHILESIGLSMCAFNYAGFFPVTTGEWDKTGVHLPDPLLGWSMFRGDESLPGVNMIGNGNQEDIRILILGGSTSTDGIYRVTSWVRLLYQKLVRKGFAVTLYDCAGLDEDVLQELLRLIRDGIHLKPHYVISMSGVNNRIHRIGEIENKANLKHLIAWLKELSPGQPYVCGIPKKEDAFTYWCRIQKIIKAVTEVYGAKYLGFLQPVKEAKPELSIFEKSVHYNADGYNEIEKFNTCARDDDFYENLLHLFDEKEEMFIDICHYSEKANCIIAEIVCRKLLENFADSSLVR